MSSEKVEWQEQILKGVPVSDAVFSPDNTIVALLSGKDVILHVVSDHQLKRVVECSDVVVSVHFKSQDELITVTVNGELTEWILATDKPTLNSTRRVTAFAVKNVMWSDNERESVWVLGGGSKETSYTVSLMSADLSLQKIINVPTTLKRDQIALGDGFITYCDGKDLSVVPLYDDVDSDSDIRPQTYTHKSKINGLSAERNERNVFVRVAACKDTVAASLVIGQVLVWSHVSTEGLKQVASHSLHWHKISAPMALTPHGGLVSAGAETVLCKFTLGGFGHGYPSRLPRLAAPVIALSLSADASRVALLMEDNSVHVVLLASMSILSSLPSITWCARSPHNIFMCDPRASKLVVMNAKPGSVQWLQTGGNDATKAQANFTLENAVDADMSEVGIIPTYHELEEVMMSMDSVVTLESLVNFQQEHKRLRFWQRDKKNSYEMKLLESVHVAGETKFISCCQVPVSDDDRVVIACTSTGDISVWMPWLDGSKWRNDADRSTHWQGSVIRCVSPIQSGPYWASAHVGANIDTVVIWDVNTMKVVEVLPSDGRVSSLSWASSGLLVIASSVSVSCWNMNTGTLAWTVEQSLGVHCGQFGCVAWDGDQVIEFDASSGRLLDSLRFSSPVSRLVVVRSPAGNHKCVVAETANGLAVLYSSIGLPPTATAPVSGPTPFGTLASASVPVEVPSRRLPAREPNALRLLDAPCHALPPIAHIAPIFITSCLAPPPTA